MSLPNNSTNDDLRSQLKAMTVAQLREFTMLMNARYMSRLDTALHTMVTTGRRNATDGDYESAYQERIEICNHELRCKELELERKIHNDERVDFLWGLRPLMGIGDSEELEFKNKLESMCMRELEVVDKILGIHRCTIVDWERRGVASGYGAKCYVRCMCGGGVYEYVNSNDYLDECADECADGCEDAMRLINRCFELVREAILRLRNEMNDGENERLKPVVGSSTSTSTVTTARPPRPVRTLNEVKPNHIPEYEQIAIRRRSPLVSNAKCSPWSSKTSDDTVTVTDN